MGEENRLFSWWLFLFFLCSFFIISNGRFGGDGLENYLTAESIVLDRDFSIHDRPFVVNEMRYEDRGRMGSDGKLYSSYGLGMAFILVPFYLLGHIAAHFFRQVPHDYITQFFVSLSNPLILALLALLLFKFLRKLGYASGLSFISVLIFSFCSMNLIYSRCGFSEPAVALLLILAVFLIHLYSIEKRIIYLLLAGISFGYAIFIKKNSFILLPAFLFYLSCVISPNIKNIKSKSFTFFYLAAFLMPILVCFFAIILQNKVLYGGISQTEFGTVKDMLAHLRWKSSTPLKGLYYYLLSSGKGYLIYNIALILGLFSIKDFFKKYRSLCVFIIFLLLSNLAFYVFIYTRGSIFSWGPRYLFPTLPLLAVLLAEFMQKNSILRRKITIFIFALLGFAIQLPAIFVNFSKYIFFVKEKLQLPEYLIDFMPDLSPIRGAWMLFASFIQRHLRGESLHFLYNPDFKFIQPLSVSLKGYDIADIWWINIAKVKPQFMIYGVISVFLIVLLLLFSFLKIVGYVKKYESRNRYS